MRGSANESPAAQITRRRVLRLMATAAALPAGAGAAPQMLSRPIPASGETIPAVGLGTWRVFDVGGGEAERAPLRDVLKSLVELGGRVVDSSPMYGAAESVVGDLARELAITDKLFLATKVWTSGRNAGVTHYTASAYDELERVLRAETLDFVQVNYSLGEREAERRILPLARDRGVAVLANRPFAEGGLFQRVRAQPVPPWAAEFDCESWAQFFLKWILAEPSVTCVIPGTSRLQHLADNLKAALGRLPDQAMRDRMAAHIRTV